MGQGRELTWYLFRYNEGQGKPGEFAGSAFSWRRQKDKAYAGQVAGTCEYFVDLDGNGRADIHGILGTFTNEAKTSLAPDCGLRDTKPGDDPEVSLPDPPNPNPDPDDPDEPDEYCIEGEAISKQEPIEFLCRFTCQFGFW